ncbi:MAG: hypothetical protein ACOC53_07950 [Candidatus Saliniplasma sp.]
MVWWKKTSKHGARVNYNGTVAKGTLESLAKHYKGIKTFEEAFGNEDIVEFYFPDDERLYRVQEIKGSYIRNALLYDIFTEMDIDAEPGDKVKLEIRSSDFYDWPILIRDTHEWYLVAPTLKDSSDRNLWGLWSKWCGQKHPVHLKNLKGAKA